MVKTTISVKNGEKKKKADSVFSYFNTKPIALKYGFLFGGFYIILKNDSKSVFHKDSSIFRVGYQTPLPKIQLS